MNDWKKASSLLAVWCFLLLISIAGLNTRINQLSDNLCKTIGQNQILQEQADMRLQEEIEKGLEIDKMLGQQIIDLANAISQRRVSHARDN